MANPAAAPQTQATVPIFGPDGKAYDIPYDQMHSALNDGGKMGVYMLGPDQKQYVIPADQVQSAIKGGGKIVPYNLDVAHQKEGFWNAAGDTLKRMFQSNAHPAYEMYSMGVTPNSEIANEVNASIEPQKQAADAADAARVAAGHGDIYRAAAIVTSPVADVQGMEKAAEAGDTSGVLGHAFGSAAPAVAPLAIEGAFKGADFIKGTAKDAALAKATSAVRSTVPEAASLPDQAIYGAEKVYRAAAPVGSDPQFRGNLYKAAGDLAEIGRDISLKESKGGIIQPDMRVRATVEALNDHLHDMYQGERAPQITRNAKNPVSTDFGTDANDGLAYLSRRAGTANDRGLATRAIQDDHLTLADTDQLARLTNKELLNFESMTPAEKAANAATSRRIAGLKALDQELGTKIANELESRGEPGIRDYEQRYAALSGIRDQLQRRMNAVELQRSIPGARTIHGLTGGAKGIASASQAAVADVNIGRELQLGLQSLADSGLKPTRAVGTGTVPIRGMLGTGSIPLPSSVEPITPPGPPAINVEPTSRAQRLNLMLPEKAGGRVPLPESSLPQPTSAPAMRIEPTTTPQRLGRLLPQKAGGPYVSPVPGAMDFTPPFRDLAPLDSAGIARYLKVAKGNRELAQRIAAQDGFSLPSKRLRDLR